VNTLSACRGIGGDGCKMRVTAASLAAGKFVIRTIMARLGVDDEIAAGKGIKNHVDKTGTGNDSTYFKY